MRKTRASKTGDGDIGPSINKMQQLVQLSREIRQNAEAATASYNNVGGSAVGGSGAGGGAGSAALGAAIGAAVTRSGFLGINPNAAAIHAQAVTAQVRAQSALNGAQAPTTAFGVPNLGGPGMVAGAQATLNNANAAVVAAQAVMNTPMNRAYRFATSPAGLGLGAAVLGGIHLGSGLNAVDTRMANWENEYMSRSFSGSYISPIERSRRGELEALQGSRVGMDKWRTAAEIIPLIGGPIFDSLFGARNRGLDREIAMQQAGTSRIALGQRSAAYGARVGVGGLNASVYGAAAPIAASYGSSVDTGSIDKAISRGFSPNDVLGAYGTLAQMGADPRFWGIRGGLMSGDSLSAIAPGAMARLAAQGDLGGIASLIPLTGPGAASKYSKMAAGTLDIQGRQIMSGYGLESAQAAMSRTQARGGYVDDSTFGGVKSAMSELVSSLKAGADNIKAIVGDKSPLYKEAVAKYATAEAQLAGAGTSRITQKLGYAGGIYNRDMSGIDASAAKASLFSSDSSELLRISNYRVQRMGKYEQKVKALISTLPDGPIKDQWRGELSRLAGERVQLGAMGAQSSAQLGLSNLAISQLPSMIDASSESVYGSPQIAYNITTKSINETRGSLLTNYNNKSLPLAFRRSQLMEASQLMAGEPGRAAELQGTLLGRSATAGELNRGERSYAMGMASKYGTAGDVAGATRGAAAEILGGIGSINNRLAQGGLTFDQRASLEARGQGLRGQLADTLGTGIDDYYRKKDLSGTSLQMMRADEAEKRAAMMPFGMGGMAAAGKSIGLRRGRISELQGRMGELAQAGMLSPEKRFELESQIESLTTQNVASMAPLMSGLEDRFPARRANMNGFSRISSMGMASMFHPGLAFGSSNGSIAGRQRGNMEALIAPSDAGNGDMRGSKVESQLDELIGLFRVAFGPGGNFKNRSTFNDQNLEKQQAASKGWN